MERALESHRRELTGYCYRMLGSGSEAEDAVQDTLVRAWKASTGSRAARRSGRGCTGSPPTSASTCSAVPAPGPADGSGAVVHGEAACCDPQPENTFVQPIADDRVIATDGDPADVAAARELIRLAFVAALQHLPARQRAVLILCEVLKWQASEVAELLETSVASVNSALQRARATLASLDVDRLDTTVDPEHEALLARYVDAFERYDMTALALLRDDAVISMPPHDLWLQGSDQVIGWIVGPGHGCEGSKLVPVLANGTAGFGELQVGRPAAGSRGRSRSSRSRTAASPATTTSCTPSSSPRSGSPPS